MTDNQETLSQAAPVVSEMKAQIHKIRSISMSGVPSPAKGYTIGDVVGQALDRITKATDEMLRVLDQTKVFQVTTEPLSDVERFTNEEFAHEVELAYDRIAKLEAENERYRTALENLVNSAVVKDAPFITYSEAYLDAIEVLK